MPPHPQRVGGRAASCNQSFSNAPHRRPQRPEFRAPLPSSGAPCPRPPFPVGTVPARLRPLSSRPRPPEPGKGRRKGLWDRRAGGCRPAGRWSRGAGRREGPALECGRQEAPSRGAAEQRLGPPRRVCACPLPLPQRPEGLGLDFRDALKEGHLKCSWGDHVGDRKTTKVPEGDQPSVKASGSGRDAHRRRAVPGLLSAPASSETRWDSGLLGLHPSFQQG